MKLTKKENVMITIKQKGQLLKVRVPLYKAYEILAMIEKDEYEKNLLDKSKTI